MATEPASTAATAGNPDSPTLSKAGLINGLTIDVSKLTSDYVDLGKASDLDGDSVTVSWSIDPSTNLISFDADSNVIDLSLEKLLEKAQKSGTQLFEVQLKATDVNTEPRTTTYTFKLKVPALSDSEIGAFYAGLIYERLNAAELENQADVTIPFIKSVKVTRTGRVVVSFSEEMWT